MAAINPAKDTRNLAQKIEAVTHSTDHHEAAAARRKLAELRARESAGLLPLWTEALRAYAEALSEPARSTREWRA